MVSTGVANNDKAWLQELLSVLVGKSTGNPLSTEVVSTGVGAELENSALSIRTGRHDEDVLGVLGLSSCNDSSGNHKLFPGLGQVEVVDTFLVALVDVGFHLLGHVLSTNVNLSSDHVNEILFSVLCVKKGHFTLMDEVLEIGKIGRAHV